MPTYRARYILCGAELLEDHAISVEGDVITEVRPARPGDHDLGEVALLPGLVNAHSHAFQRAIRGRTEHIDPARPDDNLSPFALVPSRNFWTWRSRMYAVAQRMTPDDVFAVSRWAFLEMLLSGITTVGEFHYVHHQPSGAAYDDPNELAHRVIEAAHSVGIRIALLRVAYRRGGFGKESSPEQFRFVDRDDDQLLRRVDALRTSTAGMPMVTVGLAPHSIRAVPRETLLAVRDAAAEWDVPLHIHACEQRRELEESVAEYGAPPVAVFDELGMLDERLTLVHATHLGDDDLARLQRARPTVCACPTTERNLGDGFLPALELVRRNVPIALGSDSHTNIDLWEDARCVEYHERLRHEARNVLASPSTPSTGAVLAPMLAAHGARALRLNAGALRPGALADMIAVDLGHPTLVGADRTSLLNDLCLSMTPDAVRDVWVGGTQVVTHRAHAARDEAARAFAETVARLT